MSRRTTPVTLTSDERMLINMNIRHYNETLAQIDYLYGVLSQIRSDINYIYQGRMPHVEQETPRNRYRYRNGNGYNDYYRMRDRIMSFTPIFYDYNNPINPSLYTTNADGFTLRNLVNRLFDETGVPTLTQINNASREIVYSDIENPITEVCPISLNRFQPTDIVRQIHHCGHIFGTSDFNAWFLRSSFCPVCRYDIRNYNANTQRQSETQRQTVQVASGISDNDNDNYSDTETEEDDEAKTQDEHPFANVTVSRDRNNNVSEVSFDISNNFLRSNVLGSLTQNLLQSVLYGDFSQPTSNTYNYRLGNQEFVYDASNNVLMYETTIRPNLWR